jgi:hypothetical protein
MEGRAMSGHLPLHEKESLQLEFKGADALKNPEKIAREVVAMLNADGGKIWIGLRDEGGRAVAVESIPESEANIRSLLDFLVDSIEPSPAYSEVKIESVSLGQEVVLCVAVTPDRQRKPYGLIRKGGRFFWTRIEDRIRLMDREEIRRAFAKPNRSSDALDRAEQALAEELKKLQAERHQKSDQIFWLRVKPAPDFSLNLDALLASDLLIDPTLTGNRRAGQNFTAAYTWGGRHPQRAAHQLIVGKEDVFQLSIRRHEGIEFRAPLGTFHAGVEDKIAPSPLEGLALLEYPISLFRLLGKMLEDGELWEESIPQETVFLATVALLGLEGWSLRPFSYQPGRSQGSWLDYLRNKPRFFDRPDFTLEKPVPMRAVDVKTSPDWCGFRLIRLIYEDFGYGADEMPPEFDQKVGRLILPE